MTYKKAIEQAVMAHKLGDQTMVNNEIVKKISAEYRWSEQKVRKDIEAAMFSGFSTYEERTDDLGVAVDCAKAIRARAEK